MKASLFLYINMHIGIFCINFLFINHIGGSIMKRSNISKFEEAKQTSTNTEKKNISYRGIKKKCIIPSILLFGISGMLNLGGPVTYASEKTGLSNDSQVNVVSKTVNNSPSEIKQKINNTKTEIIEGESIDTKYFKITPYYPATVDPESEFTVYYDLEELKTSELYGGRIKGNVQNGVLTDASGSVGRSNNTYDFIDVDRKKRTAVKIKSGKSGYVTVSGSLELVGDDEIEVEQPYIFSIKISDPQLAKEKEEATKKIEDLNYLTLEEKEAFTNQVNAATDIPDVQKIVEEANKKAAANKIIAVSKEKETAQKNLTDEATKTKAAIEKDPTLTNEEKASQKNNVDKALAEAQKGIDAATTIEEINTNKTAGIKKISEQHQAGKSVDSGKTQAKNDSTLTKKEKSSQDKALVKEQKGIDAATTTEKINANKSTGIKKISKQQKSDKKSTQKKLPKTGEDNDRLISLLGLFSLLLLGITKLLKFKTKNNNLKNPRS